jgi:hypothetical protein
MRAQRVRVCVGSHGADSARQQQQQQAAAAAAEPLLHAGLMRVHGAESQFVCRSHFLMCSTRQQRACGACSGALACTLGACVRVQVVLISVQRK